MLQRLQQDRTAGEANDWEFIFQTIVRRHARTRERGLSETGTSDKMKDCCQSHREVPRITIQDWEYTKPETRGRLAADRDSNHEMLVPKGS